MGEQQEFGATVVCDIGTGVAKFGVCSNDTPSFVFPNVIGEAKYNKCFSDFSGSKGYLVGSDAIKKRGVMSLKYQGRDQFDSERLFQIMDHVIERGLLIEAQDHPFLFTETPLQHTFIRERIAALMFDSYRPPAMFFGMEGALALYGTGRSSGLVLGSGDSYTYSVPVLDWKTQHNAIQKTEIGGRDVTEKLVRGLYDKGVRLTTSAEFEIAREMKESYCYVALIHSEEKLKPVDYCLPDGQKVIIDQERFDPAEIVFHPRLIGQDVVGIHKMCVRSILQCNKSCHEKLLNNIILSGGNTMLSGFSGRIDKELRRKIRKNNKIKIISPHNRDVGAWVGGTALARLSTFKDMWISVEEYEEYGSSIVNRCLSMFEDTKEVSVNINNSDLLQQVEFAKPSFSNSMSFTTEIIDKNRFSKPKYTI